MSHSDSVQLDPAITKEIISRAFVPLVSVNDFELFEIFYCSRHSTRGSFIRMLAAECMLGGNNIVLCGAPGVGKTTFIDHVFRQKPLLQRHKLSVHVINCRKYEGKDETDKLQYLKTDLVDELEKYFKSVELPCNDLRVKPASEDVDFGLVTAKNHLFTKISKSLQSKKCFPVLVIDDVDYMEEEIQHVMLNVLSDLISSDRVSIIYACRKPALKEINYHLSDRPRYDFTKKAKIEELYPLEAQRVLARRLALTLKNPTAKSCIVRILSGFPFNKKHVFERYINKFGYSLDSAPAIQYPFTDSQEYYINELSNGDIRIIFRIAEKLLEFILDPRNRKTWERQKDGSCHIGKDNLLGVLSDFKGRQYRNPHFPIQYPELWRLINLHERQSYSVDNPSVRGNSLLQNILELIVNEREICVGSHFREILQILGHRDHEIDLGVSFCLEARLIEPVIISTSGPSRTREDKKYTKYRLTKKGEFYIKEVINWKEYVTTFGKGRTSVYDLDNELGQSKLYSDILEMLCALIYYCNRSSAYLKVGKRNLYDFFILKYGTGYIERYDFVELDDRYTVDLRRFERELVKDDNTGIASSHKEHRRDYFKIKKHRTINQALGKGIAQVKGTPVFPSYKFHGEEVITFLRDYTKELA